MADFLKTFIQHTDLDQKSTGTDVGYPPVAGVPDDLKKLCSLFPSVLDN